MAVLPVPVFTEALDDPAFAATGTDGVARAVTIFPLLATAETTVPALSPERSISRVLSSVTVFSSGTGMSAGFADVAETEVPSTVRAVETAALAGVAIIMLIPMAATRAKAIFLNEFIFLLFIIIYTNLNCAR